MRKGNKGSLQGYESHNSNTTQSHRSFQFSSLAHTVVGGMRDNSKETLFKTFLQEAVVSNYGMGGDGLSLLL